MMMMRLRKYHKNSIKKEKVTVADQLGLKKKKKVFSIETRSLASP